jgi:hypothetical protein
MKDCPEGKVRNPATGRCIKAKIPKAPAAPKELKECPEGKVRNPATGRCIKAKIPKDAEKTSTPKKKDEYIYKYEGVEYDNLTSEEKNLKKKLPSFIPDRFIYNIDIFLDDLKKGSYSSNTILHTIKTILNDLEDINSEVLSDKETRTPKQQLKYNPFIKYNDERIKKVNDYKKYVLDKINKPVAPKPKAKRPISPVFDMLDDVSPIKAKRKAKRPISPVFDMLNDVSPIKAKRKTKSVIEEEEFYDAPEPVASELVANKKLVKSNISSKFKLLFKGNKASILDRINFYIYIKSLYLKVKNKLKYCDSDDIILDKSIGSPSAFGDIYLAHFKGKLGKFAIKTIKKASNIKPFINVEVKLQDLLTKYVVDFKSIHFPITYGTLYCPRPKRVYQLNELANGDMKEIVKLYLKDYDETEISERSKNPELINKSKTVLNCYGQCLIAALMFNTYTEHLHNDTHFGNFLYHTVDKGGYFHYKYDNKDYYLENLGYVIVIWDFGLSIPFNDELYPIFRDIEYIMDVIIYYYESFIKDTLELNKYLVSLRTIPSNTLDYDEYYIIIDVVLRFLVKIGCLSTNKPNNIINKNPFNIMPTVKPNIKDIKRPTPNILDILDMGKEALNLLF